MTSRTRLVLYAARFDKLPDPRRPDRCTYDARHRYVLAASLVGPFGAHVLNVLFSGEISPKAATLWVWVTNLRLSHGRVYAIANNGGRARNSLEPLAGLSGRIGCDSIKAIWGIRRMLNRDVIDQNVKRLADNFGDTHDP